MSLPRFSPRLVLLLIGITLLPAPAVQTAASDDNVSPWLTSRPRPTPPPAQALAVGEDLRTGPGERRRVMLPGGATLYVDQNTEVRVQTANQLNQLAGEVFVETAPSPKAPPLEVVTPTQTIRGAQAGFGVRLEPIGGASVVVTRGRANVELLGKDIAVPAGKQLPAGRSQPTAAPRASHLLAWTRELRVAAEAPLVPPSQHAGGALIAKDPNGDEAHLSLRRYHIDVYIEDGFARTTIDQTYFNDRPWQLEGTFYFPLPADASLSRLAMYVNGVLMEGGMAERDYARQVYETIRYTQRDPALLEWVDGSTFKMRVFPLEPRQEKRIILSYTQKLPALYGEQTYRFPAGHSLQSVRDWSFHARVKGGAELLWGSPSHTLTSAKEKGDLVLDGHLKDATFDRDVVVTLAEREPAQEAFRYSETVHEGYRYLMLRYRPKVKATAEAGGLKHWVFLFESSGDRDPLLARVQVELIRHFLTQVEPQDTFMVLSAGTRVRSWNPEPMPVTPENVQAALAFLENAHLIGALDLGQALTASTAALQKHAHATLIHVGSGIAAMGERRDDVLAKMVPEGTRYVGVGVGRRWARGFMKNAAERSRGYFTQVNPDEPVAWRAFDLAATLSTPRLLDIQVRDRTGKAKFLVFRHDVAQGEELCALTRIGRDDPRPDNVMIRFMEEGVPIEFTVKFLEQAGRADYLPRMWAKLEIDRLLAEDAVKHKEQIIALSKAMYVMSPFTSLLVLENEDLYTQYKVDRGRQDHWAMYPCPKKIPVVIEPDPNVPGGMKDGPKTAKQVLETIICRKSPQLLVRPTSDDLVVLQAKSLSNFDQIRVLALDPAVTQAGIELSLGKSDAQLRSFAGHGMMLAGVVKPSPTGGVAGIPFQGRPASFLDGGEQADVKREPAPANAFRDLSSDHFTNWTIGMSLDATDLPKFIKAYGLERSSLGIFGTSRPDPNVKMDVRSRRVIADGQLLAYPLFRQDDPHRSRMIYPVADLVEGFAGFAEAPALEAPEARQLAHMSSPSIYQRPSYSDDAALFSDLLSYAPGMNTSLADVQAVIENETVRPAYLKSGRIDDGARALFARSRQAGWQSLTFPGQEGQPELSIHFDGQGRYRMDHVLGIGLKESLVCDGKTLLHLYPELGLGAQRTVSRFHRDGLWQTVPWAVPPVEDLAHGADVKLIAPRTVAVVPHFESLLQDKIRKNPAGKSPKWLRLHLVFDGDGRLAERQLVRMPKQEIVYRELLGADGVVRVLDEKGKELLTRKAILRDAAAPDLTPDTKNFVMLALPYRTPDHVKHVLKIEKTPTASLMFKDALPLLSAYMAAGNTKEAVTLFKEVFHAKEQRQLGFYVLLAACGANLDGTDVEVLAEHLDEPVAQYLALHSSPVLRKHASQWAVRSAQWGSGFLSHLASSHALYQRWQDDRVLKTSPARRKAEIERALEYVRHNQGSAFGWVLLTLLQDRADKDQEFHRALVDSWKLFEKAPGLSYAARYEHARSLWKSGQKDKAGERFLDLYADTLNKGGLPPFDADFRKALFASWDHIQPEQADAWNGLMRVTAAKLIADKRRSDVLALAWQCWQLEDQPLAHHLMKRALEGITEARERIAMRFAAIEFLWQTGQLVQADQELRKLLADPKFAKNAGLWRLGVKLAERRELSDRALECLEQALELEYRRPPAVIDLNQVRQDYAKLLAHYQHLADAMVTLKIRPPEGFLTRAVRAADRWRALDNDPAAACQAAAHIVQKLGESDLSWDYLTTAIGMKPNEPGPWLELAGTLGRTGELDLADRAYAAAFAAEPTNAQILWDRAQNLRQRGKRIEAGRLFRQIAEGRWQPRFQGVQTQARLEVR